MALLAYMVTVREDSEVVLSMSPCERLPSLMLEKVADVLQEHGYEAPTNPNTRLDIVINVRPIKLTR